jgi:hypothetical protein
MTPLVRTEETALTQAEKRPMAQKIGIGSLILGAVFLVAFSIIGVLAK